ncbi:MAG: hypothetical protein ACE5R4_11585, partial [Armatimonadota bacterium]
MRTRVLMIGVLLSMAATAQGQRVTVDFVGAPIQEALEELEQQAGVHIEGVLWPEEDQPSVDLQMEEAPLRAVLRAICRQANCHFWQSGRHVFYLQEGPNPAEQCPTTQVGPYTIRVGFVRLADTMTLAFARRRGNPLSVVKQMTIGLSVEADEDIELEAVAGVHPGATAVENTGKTVEPTVKELPSREVPMPWRRPGSMPVLIRLALPSPEAIRLRALEGDILVHRDVQPLRFEFPLEGPRQPQTVAGHTVTITSIERRGERDYEVKAKWQLPRLKPGEPMEAEPFPSYSGYLVTARGEAAGSGSSEVGGIGPTTNREFGCSWQMRAFPEVVPEKFVLEIVLKSAETETLHYKFEDIPLPTWEE